MDLLYMIELQPELTALLRFIHNHGLEMRDGDQDLGYGVHAWLAAAYGKISPKPWRLLLDRRRPPRILGYSHHNAAELRGWTHEFADPGAFAVCLPEAISSRSMPAWRPGRRLAFELQCCPVGRKTRTGIEKDLFLIRTDSAGKELLQRDTIYCDWVREQLHRNQAATVTAIRLAGYRLTRQTRQAQAPAGQRTCKHSIRPQALVKGELIVNDPNAFSELLARGVGRHRSFGYGMLLLRPPS